MNKEFLIEKIRTLTDCAVSEKEAAFQFLIKSISKKIRPEQGLKIPGLGFFQLKNEPLPREERKEPSKKIIQKQTLIYAPFYENERNDFDNLFISIDIDNSDLKEYTEIDKIFSLGFGKPTIPLPGQDSRSFLKKLKDYRIKKSFEEVITEFIEKAETLYGYNIFSDYIEKSYLTNSSNELEDETIRELITEPEESTEPSEILNLENGISHTEDSLKVPDDTDASGLEKVIDEIEMTDESIEKLFSDEELEKVFVNETNIDNPKSESQSEIIPESPIEENNRIDELEVRNEVIEFEPVKEIEKEPKSDEKRKTMFDKLDEVLNKSDSEELIEELSDSEVTEESFIGNKNDSLQNDLSNETLPGKKFAFYKSFVFWFAVIFVIVLAIVSYLIAPNYFLPESKLKRKSTVSTKISGQVSEKKSSESDVISPAAVKVDSSLITSATSKEEKSLYRKPAQDKRISNQIYFDGVNYTVQVSSWLDKSIAENEVMKFRAKGIDAFIYQAFVPAKGSTWSRVRIGNFRSVAEAEKFLINNQLKE